MLVDHPLINRRMFYPRPSDREPTLVVNVDGDRLACYAFQRHPRAGDVA
jgi:hypothetical protein